MKKNVNSQMAMRNCWKTSQISYSLRRTSKVWNEKRPETRNFTL